MLLSRPSKKRRVRGIEQCSVLRQDGRCCLKPFVKELVKPTDLVPDLHDFVALLAQIHSLLSESDSRCGDESLNCLQRVAIIRIGLLFGNRRGFMCDADQPEILKAISLVTAILCQTFRRQQCVHSELLVVYHTVLQILEVLNKLGNQVSSRSLVVSTLENCMDLVDIWFRGNFNINSLMCEHSFLGEALILAFLRSVGVFEDQRISKSIRNFFWSQSRSTRCTTRWKNLFEDALRVLDMQDDVGLPEIPDCKKDFHQSCILARNPSMVKLPAYLEVVLHHIRGFEESANKEWLTKNAFQILDEHSRSLDSSQVSQCLDATSSLIIALDVDSPVLLPAIKCLGTLLENDVGGHFKTDGRTTRSVLERLRKMVFSGKWHDSEVATGYALVGLLALALRSPDTSTGERKPYLSLLCQLMMLCIDGVIDRSIDLLRTLLEEKSERTRILQVYPELVTCLAEVGSEAHISDDQKEHIATLICNLLSDERSANNLIRGPWILRFFVSVLTEESTSFLSVQLMVLQILCDLSANPSNRRILAKQIGLLTSMIQFARRDRGIFEVGGGLSSADIKDTIQSLARVL